MNAGHLMAYPDYNTHCPPAKIVCHHFKVISDDLVLLYNITYLYLLTVLFLQQQLTNNLDHKRLKIKTKKRNYEYNRCPKMAVCYKENER
jgi:hypothetical protein